MRLEYWDFFTAPTLAKAFPDGFPGYALEHAAVLETSMMLHYHPELVRLDRIPNDPPADFPPYDIYPTRTDWVPPSGVLSSAKSATKEKGAAMVAGTHDPDLRRRQERVLMTTPNTEAQRTQRTRRKDDSAEGNGRKCERRRYKDTSGAIVSNSTLQESVISLFLCVLCVLCASALGVRYEPVWKD